MEIDLTIASPPLNAHDGAKKNGGSPPILNLDDGLLEMNNIEIDEDDFNLDEGMSLKNTGYGKKSRTSSISIKNDNDDDGVIDLLNDNDDNWFREIPEGNEQETKAEKSRKRIRSNSMTNIVKNSGNGKRPYRPFGLAPSDVKRLNMIKLRSEQQMPDAPDEVEINSEISKVIKNHQLKGIKFLWRRVAADKGGVGCVLADFMGLGKTLQVIGVIQAFHTQVMSYLCEPSKRRTLILAPAIVVANWRSECLKWLSDATMRNIRLKLMQSSDMKTKTMAQRASKLNRWRKKGGVLIMGYEMFRLLVTSARCNEDDRKKLDSALLDPGPHLIVLDEGHRIRKAKSRLTRALSRIRTKRRIVMTGYPLQNHLAEYWTMINFAFPNYLGQYDQFRRRFEVPILNGQCKDSTRWDIRKARQRAFVLNKEIKPLVLRRGAKFLYSMLPPKKEWVIQVRMVKLQGDLYRAYLRHRQRKMGNGNREILSAFQISLMIVNHPDLLFRAMIRSRDKSRSEQPRESNRPAKNIEQKTDKCVDEDLTDDSDVEFMKECTVETHDYSWAESLLENHKLNVTTHSGKMLILMKILEYSVRMNERITVFSQSLGTLDIIENLLRRSNESLSSSGYFYFLRIDGGTSLPHRFERIQRFNDDKDKTNVMLVSTRAGGEGVNLVGGTRVVLFDCCWNPCHDHQSMCRSHRYGQKKPVYVYRLVGNGTMEKKIYDLQIRKESLSKRIVDNDAVQRHFRSDELNEYMSMEQYKKEMNAELSGNDDVGDDKIMARLIKSSSKYMRQWFLQDSMLMSDAEGMCQEEEYEVAIQEYKREIAGFGVQHDPTLSLRHKLMLPQYGAGDGNSSSHMLQRLLEQQRKQVQVRMKINCPRCGTASLIPVEPPTMNYVVTCGNAACGMKMKPQYQGGPLLGARILLQRRDIENASELCEKAKSLGAKFVVQVKEANIIITAQSSIEKMCEKLDAIPVMLAKLKVFKPSWLQECIRLRRPVDPSKEFLHAVPRSEVTLVNLLDDDDNDMTLDLSNVDGVDDVISVV